MIFIQKNLPLPPGNLGLPFIGETKSFRNNIQGFATERRQQYGELFKTRLFGRKIIYMYGPEANKFILTNENKYFVGSTVANSRSIFGTNTLTWLQGQEHQKKRQILAQAFQNQNLAKYIDLIKDITQKYLAKWEKASQIIWYPELGCYSFDILGKLLAGIDSASQTEMISCLKNMASGLSGFPLPFTKSKYGLALASRKQLLAIIEKSISQRKLSSNTEVDILSILLKAQDNKGSRLSSIELKEQIINLLFLGYKELNSALTSFCLLTAQYPETKEHIRRELNQIGAPELLTLDNLKNMPYLERVFKEVLRLIPPVIGGFRKVIKDCEFNGYRLPTGWTILYRIDATHKNPEIYPQPEKFNPDRFLPERAENKKYPYSYIPFGGGARECIGREFAFLVMKIFASLLVSNYAWELLPNQDLSIVGIGNPKPRDNLKVEFRKVHHH